MQELSRKAACGQQSQRKPFPSVASADRNRSVEKLTLSQASVRIHPHIQRWLKLQRVKERGEQP